MSYPQEGAKYKHEPKWADRELKGEEKITPYKQSYFKPDKPIESMSQRISKVEED